VTSILYFVNQASPKQINNTSRQQRLIRKKELGYFLNDVTTRC